MAVTASPRLGLTRWGAGTDPLRRAQLDADHSKLDDLAAISLPAGPYNARPAAGVRGRFYPANDQGPDEVLYYDTGAEWVLVGSPPADLSPYLPKAGGTITGDLTIGDADTDLLKVRAVEVETHARTITTGYTGNLLTSITEKAGATTVRTTTLGYTADDLVDTITETAGGITVTTTLAYDGAGNLTGTTRSVA